MSQTPTQNYTLHEPVADVAIAATPDAFVIRDRIRPGNGVKFGTVWHEFKNRFGEKIEPPRAGFMMLKFKLLEIAPDEPIIAELGGAARAETTLSAAFGLMSRQAAGQLGILQTNGHANIFYVSDQENELCAVRVSWSERGWEVGAIPARDPLAWNGQHQIFCPIA